MSQPSITVIIPCYNEENVIADCIDSLQKQTLADWECYIVDDGSLDSTASIAQSATKKDSRFHLLKQRHSGPAQARNLAAQKALGDILVFVDADMILDPAYLNELTREIKQGSVIGTFTRSEFVGNWENPWARCWNYEYTHSRSRSRLPVNHPDTSKVFRAITKKAFQQVSGFDDAGYNDDWTLSKKLNQLAVAADKAIVYHKNPESALEVSLQASWVGKREYKFGLAGAIWALFRANPFFSLLIGSLKAVYYMEPHYLVFKHVYNAGLTIGILMQMKNLPRIK